MLFKKILRAIAVVATSGLIMSVVFSVRANEEIQRVIPIYSLSGTHFADYYETEKGYVIWDNDLYRPIEFSEEGRQPFIRHADGPVVMTGPLSYFVVDDQDKLWSKYGESTDVEFLREEEESFQAVRSAVTELRSDFLQLQVSLRL